MKDNSICYSGIGCCQGVLVRKSKALEYAMKRCGIVFINEYNELDRADFLHDFVPWYFSGNYIERAVDD